MSDIACDIIGKNVRLVFDTDVVVAAFRSPTGASRLLLRAVLAKQVLAVVSVPLFLEYEAVLTRPEHLTASRLTMSQVHAVLDALASVSVHASLSFRWRPLLADADDDMVLEAAINGMADFLVTFNIGHFGSAGEPFGCRVLIPGDALKMIQSKTS